MTLIAGLSSALHPDTENPTNYRTGISWLAMGILVSAVGVMFMILELSLHEHFNQNDLYHLIQVVGLFSFYEGVVRLHGLANDTEEIRKRASFPTES